MSDLAPLESQNKLDDTYDNQGEYGNRFYREFNLKKLLLNKYPEYEKESQELFEILEQILSDPCNVVIGDLYLEIDEDKCMARIWIEGHGGIQCHYRKKDGDYCLKHYQQQNYGRIDESIDGNQ